MTALFSYRKGEFTPLQPGGFFVTLGGQIL